MVSPLPGEKEKSMFATEGNDIILPYSFEASDDYFRVTWTCTPNPGRVATFLVNEGRITDVGQDRKMKLLPDCSLQINKLRREDAGLYIGVLKNENRQYLLLNILEISSSPHLEPFTVGTAVTLSCSLHGYDICTVITEREIKFTWFHENGSELNGDTRYHIHQNRCRSALTVTLDQSDHNRKWTCQLTVDGRVKSSASYITTVSGTDSFSTVSVGLTGTDSFSTVSVGLTGTDSFSTVSVVLTGTDSFSTVSVGPMATSPSPGGTGSVTAIQLPIRLAVFFFILALPLIIGAVIYTRKRIRPIRDQVSSGTELHEYVNTNNKP
nr:uncharacterized protein LOC111852404 [Paramormyrops kingsleyae]